MSEHRKTPIFCTPRSSPAPRDQGQHGTAVARLTLSKIDGAGVEGSPSAFSRAVEYRAETTSPGVFVALAAPGEADEGTEALLPRGALLYGAGVGLLVAIGLGSAYFVGFHRQDIEWAKLAVHLVAYCMASSAALSVMLDIELGRRAASWASTVRNAARGGALAAALPGAFALGYFARLRMDFIGAVPLALAAITVVGLLSLRVACRQRGIRGYLRALAKAFGISLAAASMVSLCYGAVASFDLPAEWEAATIGMRDELRAENLLDAFYYCLGTIGGAFGGAAVGAFVGLWGLGRSLPEATRTK
jgi:hypothetical protein